MIGVARLFVSRLPSSSTGTPACVTVTSGKKSARSHIRKSCVNSMDVRTALKTGIAKLREAGVPSFTLSAELLLLHVATRDRTWLYSHPEENLPQEITDRFFALIARRAAGEPTQYLTGKQEFWGLEFEVTPAVLIPRPETEHVIEVALDRLALRELRAGRPQKTIGEGLQIADIGTGSGCIAIALAKELPKAKFVRDGYFASRARSRPPQRRPPWRWRAHPNSFEGDLARARSG